MTYHIGTCSYAQSLNCDVWIHCYLTHAYQPEALFPAEFQQAAAAVLSRDFGIEERYKCR